MSESFDGPVSILVVDDDDVDIMAVKRGFKKANMLNPLHVAHNGLEALDFLKKRHAESDEEKPLLILLDINMPKMDGFEFLSELRANPEFTKYTVFIQSTSNDTRDRSKAYRDHVAGYIVKGQESTLLPQMLSAYFRIIEFGQEAGR